MKRRKEDVLAWESRWSLPTGLVTFVAIVILIVSAIVIADVNGSGEAELLVSAHENSSSIAISSTLEAIGFLLLTAPLYFLFRAALARAPGGKMKSQLVGVIVVAPLFFAISGVLNGIATNEAADTFHKGQAQSTVSAETGAEECRAEERDKGAKAFGEKYDSGASPLKDCEAEEQEESKAKNALSEASVRDAATGFGLAGRIGLAVALIYSCLWAMRVGLLTRFWGSLGMALGVAALVLLVQFCLIFFIYFALLLVGKLPGGRPPAWAAGEAVPWPTPGERMAKEIEPKGGGPDPEGDRDADFPTAGLPEGIEAPEPEEAPEPDGEDSSSGGQGGGPQRRKRKRRD